MNEKPQTLKPFGRLCMTIGQLPASYVESMSYYEQLIWLTKYLQDQVIPAVNNNAAALEELQNYVEHYFDNLDVQEEINNKLDAMVEDGTLANIINQEIFGELNESITTLENNLTSLSNVVDYNKAKPTILVGDSYGNEDGEWATILKSLLVSSTENLTNDDVYVWCTSGASAVKRTGTEFPTYLEILQTNANLIINKNKIERIVLCAGYNDNTFAKNAIYTALQTLYEYCRITYPNALIYFGCIGWDSNYANSTIRSNIIRNVLPAYKDVNKFGGIYLSGIEYTLHYYKNFWKSDGYHPDTNGSQILAQNIFNLLNNNQFSYNSEITNQAMTTSIFPNATGNLTYFITDKQVKIVIGNLVMGTPSSTLTIPGGSQAQTIDIGLPTIASDIMRKVNTLSTIPVTINVITNDNRYQFSGELYVETNGHYYLKVYNNSVGNLTVANMVINTCLTMDRLML